MAFDFTMTRYADILTTAQEHSYVCCGIRSWYDQPKEVGSCLLLRHDVDRRPINAAAMAECESTLGISSTYYFRIFPCSFDPDIVARVRDLGHEIGYHYEDWTTAKGDPAKAIELFSSNLDKLRRIAPVRSIAMHGSPLSRETNLRIWEFCDFRSYDLIDATESSGFEGFAFVTDTGRTFGSSSANLRDHFDRGVSVAGVSTSRDLCCALSAGTLPKVYLSTHPERWNNEPWFWLRQWAWDLSANAVKRVLRTIRQRAIAGAR